VSTATLSQNEIDRLLGRSTEALEQEPPVPSREVQLYDFRRPHRVSREKLRTLEAMYEQLVKTFEGWLLGRVRGQLEMRLQSVEQFTFGEFILSLPTPCASFLVSVANAGGQMGIVDFGPELASFLVDRLFGGSGPSTTLSRGLTPIERMAVRTIAERVVSLVQDAWEDHVDLGLEVTGFESIPEIMLGANRDDPVLVATIQVTTMGKNSLLLLCLPFTVLEKFFSASRDLRVDARMVPQHPAEQAVTESVLRGTRVQVAARLPEFRLPLRGVSSMAVGQVLATGIPTDAEVEVSISGQPRFRATAGRSGRRLALRISADLSEGSDGMAPPTEGRA
jgi:flagellar motor switch protein FliM